MNIFFTSDTHFGHDKIIHLAKRPFSSVEEMNETMIARWNMVVGKHDHVYHLGDFAVKSPRAETEKILDRLNGHIHLIEGNHEGDALKVRHRFVAVTSYQEVGPWGTIPKIVLFHYPIRSWNGIFKGSWHLHGHTHDLIPSFGKSFDIGVDSHNFNPLSLEEVAAKMATLPYRTEEEGFPGYVSLEERFSEGSSNSKT